METKSWIFLAVALASQIEPTDFRGIFSIADGINHAVPTHKELQTSISWLLKERLVEKQGRKYLLAEKGYAIYKNSTENSTGLLDTWNRIEAMFLVI